jgi:hypothetical protein
MENEKSDLQLIKAGVPQGSVLGPTLYTLFTSDLPTSSNITIGAFTDDIAILSANTRKEQHQTFSITLIYYKIGLRSGATEQMKTSLVT